MFERELNTLKRKNRYRERKIYENVIDLASNDYLGLAENKKILKKAYEKTLSFPSHAAKASMLVNGYQPFHKMLEDYLKELNGFEEGLVLGSGFLANLAVFELGRKGDLFLVDEEYHASGIIGSKLTQAKVEFFKHNDLEDLKNKNIKGFNRIFVVVEGIYSMAGDKVDKKIIDYAFEIGNLIIDEAHSVGVCGNRLLGVSEEFNLDTSKTIKIGTLGKAFGSYGAYILAKKEIIEFLLNRAKSVIYTTALSAMDAMVAFYALKEIQKNLKEFREKIALRQKLFNTSSLIKIIPSKDIKTLMHKKEELEKKGILIGAIRPPTVKTPIFRVILRTNIDIDIISKTIKELI